MKIYRSIGLNFAGNAWNGLLIVCTTPWYLSMLGMEQFGLVGFWQVLLYVFLVFDWGLGATLVREFAGLQGDRRGREAYRGLLRSIELICLPSAALVGTGLFASASWLATDWLKLSTLSVELVTGAIAWMSISAGAQLMNALYLNGLAGMQRHGLMNLIQILGYSLKYIGGGLVVLFTGDLGMFFAFQGLCMLMLTVISRWVLGSVIASVSVSDEAPRAAGPGTIPWRYAGGMFATAVLGMLLTNTDRLMLSRLVSIEDLGRYSLAITGASFLQMVVFAFYRSYYPLFSELKAAGNVRHLKEAYEGACRNVGAVVVPCAVLGWFFADELIQIWLGQHDPTTAELFRWLILGVSMAGLMWIPAAYQQANGWTSLHVLLMALALACGLPIAALLVQHWGVQGGTAIMLIHGFVEITLGLLLMNRVYFPGESLRWYRSVVLRPLLVAAPLAWMIHLGMPEGVTRFEAAYWVSIAAASVLAGMAFLHRGLMTRHRST